MDLGGKTAILAEEYGADQTIWTINRSWHAIAKAVLSPLILLGCVKSR